MEKQANYCEIQYKCNKNDWSCIYYLASLKDSFSCSFRAVGGYCSNPKATKEAFKIELTKKQNGDYMK